MLIETGGARALAIFRLPPSRQRHDPEGIAARAKAEELRHLETIEIG